MQQITEHPYIGTQRTQNTMPTRTAPDPTTVVRTATRVNNLRLRVLRAKGGFLKLGTANYIAFIEVQASKEGRTLNAADKIALRAVMNGRATEADEPTVELVERALANMTA